MGIDGPDHSIGASSKCHGSRQEGGLYLVSNSSRAILAKPQWRGHVPQHLVHVYVQDAPTGKGRSGTEKDEVGVERVGRREEEERSQARRIKSKNQSNTGRKYKI